MTALLLISLAFAAMIMPVAVFIIVCLALDKLAADQLVATQRHRIAALEAGSLSASATLADRDMVIACLRMTIFDQLERLGVAEDRAALLERIQKRNLYAALVVMPVVDRPKILERAGKISMN